MKALAITLALLSSAQAFAWSGTVLVCRMTGEVLERCCCPPAEMATHEAAIARACCCDVVETSVQAAGPAVPQVRDTDANIESWIAIPARSSVSGEPGRDVRARPATRDPPVFRTSRIWLNVRHLLI